MLPVSLETYSTISNFEYGKWPINRPENLGLYYLSLLATILPLLSRLMLINKWMCTSIIWSTSTKYDPHFCAPSHMVELWRHHFFEDPNNCLQFSSLFEGPTKRQIVNHGEARHGISFSLSMKFGDHGRHALHPTLLSLWGRPSFNVCLIHHV